MSSPSHSPSPIRIGLGHGRMRRCLTAASLALAVAIAARDASSDAVPGVRPGWFAPVGVTLGGSLHHEVPGGFLLGAEGSVVNWNQVEDGVWVGGFADALWDFGAEQARISIGPEVGFGPFGIDIGYVAAIDGDYHHGIGGRAIFTLSLVAFYFRLGKVFDTAEPDYKELGALIKLPIPIYQEDRRPRPERWEPSPAAVAGDAGAPPPPPPPPAAPPQGVATDPPPQQFAEPP